MINEDTVRRNFVLIYELLDEIMDYGYPQATATEQVKVYIFNTPAMVADNPIDFITAKLGEAGLNLKSKTSVDASAVRKPVGVGTAKGQNEVFLETGVDTIGRVRKDVGTYGFPTGCVHHPTAQFDRFSHVLIQGDRDAVDRVKGPVVLRVCIP